MITVEDVIRNLEQTHGKEAVQGALNKCIDLYQSQVQNNGLKNSPLKNNTMGLDANGDQC